MGIPGFYKWLVRKYPATLCSVVEDRSRSPPDSSKPNPNGVEFDNLYIDMNGIIHTCFHPERMPAPRSYDEIFNFIFVYVDRVFSIVRPRKLLYLAVDGVAPRAKMNHQRIRRFKAARRAARKGIGKSDGDKKLDSNVITPGTEFMDLLSCALKDYVNSRVNGDPGWRGIKVILSDSSVVGEGEDKMMSYIRSQRNLPGYDPNTRHCLHGLDADLIMLALATHEIHISILREDITYVKKKRVYSVCMRELINGLKFKFFNIWVLREYLERELLPNVVGIDCDRLVDDFVLMCLFIGNDYLPHLQSLGVYTGIQFLMMVYQREFFKMGYLTNAPEVNFKSMEHFLQALNSHENMFMKQGQLNMKKNKRKRGGFQDSVNIDDSYMKRRHYNMNFDCRSQGIDQIKRDAVFKYTEGICWIMHCYYQKVPSWQWFYPYHCAPLASDFCGLDKLEINFTLAQPFKPLDQLLGVLPAASAQALPLSYRELMTNESSPILDFYPQDPRRVISFQSGTGAKVYRHAKVHDWKGVHKLPFIDESRLLSEIAKVEHTLTDEEKKRNRFGRDMLFVHTSHPLAVMIDDLSPSDPSSEFQIQIRPDLSDGMNGYLCISDKPVFPSNIPSSPFVEKPTVTMNCVKSVDYKCPCHAHIPKLLCGVKMPPRILRPRDRPRGRVAWHVIPTSSVSQCEGPTKKRRRDDKGCILGGETEAGYCVDLAQENGKPEAEVENHLIGGKSTNQTEGQQQIKGGNGGMSDGNQVKVTEDENIGICEKPFESPKRKRKNKRKKKKKKLEAPQELDLINGGPEAEVIEHTVKEATMCETERKQEKKLQVEDLVEAEVIENMVEEATIGKRSSYHQQVSIKPTKRRHVRDGGNKLESTVAAEVVTNVENQSNKDENMNDFQVSEENAAGKKVKKGGGDVVDENESKAISTDQEKESESSKKQLGGEGSHVIEPQTESKNVEVNGQVLL